jgi:hypothetical protein
MDFVTFLVVAILMLVVFSAYYLFNDVPRFGGNGRRRR